MKKKIIANKIPTEHIEQVLFVQWAKRAGLPIFAVPNGGHRRLAVASKLKLEGVSPGVPDLFLPIARELYHGLFIEMKRQKGGSLSPEQKEWKIILESQDYRVAICKGWVSAKAQTLEYLSN